MIITACSESIQKHFPLNPNYQNCFLQTRQALYLKHYQKNKKLQRKHRKKLLFMLLRKRLHTTCCLLFKIERFYLKRKATGGRVQMQFSGCCF